MTSIKQVFQDKISAVSTSSVIEAAIDQTYGDAEFSISGLQVTARDQFGLDLGASELLYRQGFRFYAPDPKFHVLPTSLRSDLVVERMRYDIPDIKLFLSYGHGSPLPDGVRNHLSSSMNDWLMLIGCNSNRKPSGHNWINIIAANSAFFAENPQLLHPTKPNTFDLDRLSGDTICRQALVNKVAEYLLTQVNEYGYVNFDPTDGDTHDSDTIFQFAKDVTAKMQETQPNARTVVYAYAGHRAPPSFSIAGLVSVQVALAFNDLGIGYPELVRRHGEQTDEIGLREYMSIPAWNSFYPVTGKKFAPSQYDVYAGFKANRATMVQAETDANWLVNLAINAYAIRVMKFADTDFDAILTEMVTLLFNGDPAVRRLYEVWNDDAGVFSKYMLLDSGHIINDMHDGWYKNDFKRLFIVLHKLFSMPSPVSMPPEFEPHFVDLMQNVWALAESDILHSYAMVRQYANSYVNLYPHLKFNASSPHPWRDIPRPPDLSEFDTELANLQAKTQRQPELLDDDLVRVYVVPSIDETVFTGAFNESWFTYRGPAVVAVVVDEGQSGTVHFGQWVESGNIAQFVESKQYGPGLHMVHLQGNHGIVWDNCEVYLRGFPQVDMRPMPPALISVMGSQIGRTIAAVGFVWAYFQHEFPFDEYDIGSDSRITLYHPNGSSASLRRTEIKPGTDVSHIEAGQHAVSVALTNGNQRYANINPWLSCNPYSALLPVSLAEAEGFSVGQWFNG